MKPKHRNAASASARSLPSSRRRRGATAGKLSPLEVEIERKARRVGAEDARAHLPFGMQETREVDARELRKEKDDDTFSPMAIGMPDADPAPGIDNPTGVQTGRGPLNQEGQGNRQDDEAAELEEIEPNIDPYRSPH